MIFFLFFEIIMKKHFPFSSLQGLENITQILIDNGANIEDRSDGKMGKTPLEIAAVNGNLWAGKELQSLVSLEKLT